MLPLCASNTSQHNKCIKCINMNYNLMKLVLMIVWLPCNECDFYYSNVSFILLSLYHITVLGGVSCVQFEWTTRYTSSKNILHILILFSSYYNHLESLVFYGSSIVAFQMIFHVWAQLCNALTLKSPQGTLCGPQDVIRWSSRVNLACGHFDMASDVKSDPIKYSP